MERKIKRKKPLELLVFRAFSIIHKKLEIQDIKTRAFHNEVYFDLEAFKKDIGIDKMPTYKFLPSEGRDGHNLQYSNVKGEILLPALKKINQLSDFQIIHPIKETIKNLRAAGFTLFFKKKGSIKEEKPKVVGDTEYEARDQGVEK